MMKHTLASACRAAAAAMLLAAGIASAAGLVRAGTDVAPDTAIVRSEPVANETALIGQADRIAYGWFDSANREIQTGQRVKSGKLVNFTQTFHVERSLKGESPRLIRVLSTGIEPLPEADDPLNGVYPGPMIEGRYVCFLKKLPRQELYTIIGGWQGVYPIHDGKTIALEGAGFPQLSGLTVEQLAARVRR